MTAVHSLPAPGLAALLRGSGDPATVRLVHQVGLSRNLLMLRELLDRAGHMAPRAARSGFLRENFAALAVADAALAPARPAVLRYPHVGGWAMTSLRHLAVWQARQPGDEDLLAAGQLAGDLAHLGAIALAAALEARVPVQVRVPVRNGRVHLPGTGSFGVSGVAAPARPGRLVTVTYDGDRALRDGCGQLVTTVPADGAAGATDGEPGTGDCWWLLRLWACDGPGPRIRLVLDDADPYRGAFQPGPAPRLTASEAAAWQQALSAAWEVLTGRHPRLASALAAGLRVLTPLAPSPSGADSSGASRYALGAVAMSLPADPVRLAAGLVHEAEHLLLHTVRELVPLTRPATRLTREPASGPSSASPGDSSRGHSVHPSAPVLVCSPWRRDPRPATGLLFAVHAWVAVTRFWCAEGRARPGDGVAVLEWARGREMLREGARVLAGSGELTPEGHLVVDTAASVLADTTGVPPGAAQVAEDLVAEHTLRWRLRHLVPPAAGAGALAARWATGRHAVAVPGSILVPVEVPGAGDEVYARAALAMAAGRAPGPPDSPTVLLLNRDYAGALAGYEAVLRLRPADVHTWAGACLAHLRLAGLPWQQARPELAAEVARRVQPRPAAAELLRWLEVPSPPLHDHQTIA